MRQIRIADAHVSQRLIGSGRVRPVEKEKLFYSMGQKAGPAAHRRKGEERREESGEGEKEDAEERMRHEEEEKKTDRIVEVMVSSPVGTGELGG